MGAKRGGSDAALALGDKSFSGAGVLAISLVVVTLVAAQTGRVQILWKWDDARWNRVIVKLKDGSEVTYQRHQLWGLFYDYGPGTHPPPLDGGNPGALAGQWSGNFNDTPVYFELRNNGTAWSGRLWAYDQAGADKRPGPGSEIHQLSNLRLSQGKIHFELRKWKQTYDGTYQNGRMSGLLYWDGSGPLKWRAAKGLDATP